VEKLENEQRSVEPCQCDKCLQLKSDMELIKTRDEVYQKLMAHLIETFQNAFDEIDRICEDKK
jgi:hypothetical protein